MNRKQRRRERKHKNRQGREVNRRHWASHGPPVVMEEPTEAHVKDLLMEWLAPRAVLDEVANQVSQVYAQKLDDVILDVMKGATLRGMDRTTTWLKVMHGLQVKAPSMLAHIIPA